MSMIQIRGLDGADRLWPFRNSGTTMKRLEEGYRFALDARRQIENHRSQVAGTGRFTEGGVGAEVLRFAKETAIPAVSRGRLAIKQARNQVQARRDQIKTAKPDPTDIVAAFKRESIRQELLAMPRDRRDQALSRHAAELNLEVLHAVLEMSELPWRTAEQKFVSDETRAILQRHAVAPEHRAELAEIDELEEAIKLAEPVIARGRDAVRTELSMTPLAFDALAQPIEQAEAKRAPPIWLNRVEGGGVKVIAYGDGKSILGEPYLVYRTPSKEDLEVGTYFADREAYEAAVAAYG